MKKKIVVFSGAGLDAESGIDTFRGLKNSMWNNHKIEDVATPEGWRKDRKKVLDFYNERRREMPEVIPNDAHKAIVKLEDSFDVVNVTQNVSDLLERAGATHVIHLHGELTKARGALYDNKPSPADVVYDIGYNDINIGDKCKVTGSQLRPHIVWFGEYPFGIDEAYKTIDNCDILIIIGTSLNIGYTIPMLGVKNTRVVYIDPSPSRTLDEYGLNIEYIEKGAVDGMNELTKKLLETI